MKIRTLDIDELSDRLAELEGLRDAVELAREKLADATDETRAELQAELKAAEANFPDDEKVELKALESLRDDIGERGGKIDTEGGPFIHENDFEDYARELAEVIGAIDTSAGWPHNCIDWEWAAQELAIDYSSVEWNGANYLFRQ